MALDGGLFKYTEQAQNPNTAESQINPNFQILNYLVLDLGVWIYLAVLAVFEIWIL